MATLKEKLETALAEIAALKAEAAASVEGRRSDAEKAKTDLQHAKSMQDHYSKKADDATSEIETLHVVFDSLPGCIGRKTQGENPWDQKPIPAIARLCSFLASGGKLAA